MCNRRIRFIGNLYCLLLLVQKEVTPRNIFKTNYGKVVDFSKNLIIIIFVRLQKGARDAHRLTRFVSIGRC